jgi:hypothetical protein
MGIAGAPACLRRHLQSPQDLLGSSCSTQQEVAGSCSGARKHLQDKLIYVAGACGCPAGVCRHACLLLDSRLAPYRPVLSPSLFPADRGPRCPSWFSPSPLFFLCSLPNPCPAKTLAGGVSFAGQIRPTDCRLALLSAWIQRGRWRIGRGGGESERAARLSPMIPSLLSLCKRPSNRP